MKGERVLIALVSRFCITGFKSKIPEADLRERGEFSVFLGFNGALVVGFGLFAITGIVVNICQSKETLRIAGMGREFRREFLQGGPGVF